jgi:Ca2+-binding EF-hand superfamily protein
VHVFKCLDADGGGTVDKPEIMAALKVLGVKSSKEDIEAMISHVDTKNKGEVGIFRVIFILKNAHTVLLFETFDRRTRFRAIS